METLPIADSLAVVNQQIQAIRSISNEAETLARSNSTARSALEREATELRSRIRAIQSDLLGPRDRPSIAELKKQIFDEARYRELLRLRDDSRVILSDIVDVQQRAVQIKDELDGLGTEDFTDEDLRRVQVWDQNLRRLLREFSFHVFPPNEISIDPESMRPVHDGVDLGFQGSASDGLRLRWAYLLGLLESSKHVQGRHPGLLLLDGPRVYDVEASSMGAFLRACADMQSRGESSQIVLTVSEREEVIREWLGERQYEMINIGDKLLA
jgi:hypothetical protein